VPYWHLTPVEREVIGQMAAAGGSIARIGQALGRSKSTISRELRRNSMALGEGLGRMYLAFEAVRLASSRVMAVSHPSSSISPNGGKARDSECRDRA
jgi:IS30 family transposase